MIGEKPLNLQVGYNKKENQKILSKRKITDYFSCLVVVMVVDLAGWLHFFVEVVAGLTIYLAIDGIVLTRREIAVGFLGLSLW